VAGTLISQATLLHRLQTVDLAIAQRRSRLADIEALLGKDESVVQARGQLEAADKALKPWQIRSRDLDLEIKGVAQKILTTDQHLYSGKVNNPKELADMQEEIASLKRRQSQLEDSLLEAMLRAEEGQAAVVEAQQALSAAEAAWAGSQTDLIDERKRLEIQLVDLEAKRKVAAEPVDSANLAKYETLRPKRRGQVVALLQGDSCALCGVEQTSMNAQQVRQGHQMVLCESCGRILATP
jgi:predicted  nucleic acid-binding Zn-ribbon protein